MKLTERPEYNIWCAMRERCSNPNNKGYKYYGARGIKVDQEWQGSFETFFRDVGPRPSPQHSIDRINNNGNYEPGNVRWATVYEQAQNKRSNRLVTINGETRCVAEWARIAGLKEGTVYYRLINDYPEGRLLEPVITEFAVCDGCGIEFTPSRKWQRCCTIKCYEWHRNRKLL